MDILKIKSILLTAAKEVNAHINELTELDSVLGDGDHGITMKKLTDVMISQLKSWTKETNPKEGLEKLTDSLDDVSGGSAGPLFSSFIYGMAEAVDSEIVSIDDFLKAILIGAYEEFKSTSKSEPGNKSMMDAISPATMVIKDSDLPMKERLKEAAKAARTGSDHTCDMLAKYGRARYIGKRCLGHKDPGSVTFAYFYEGLARGYENNF